MESGAAAAARPRASLFGVCLVATALVLFRSAVWTLWAQSDFDSDQAITGLMAKHLSEFRAFPLMFYGQQYMLAVSAWLAAPFFKLFGVSVLTLRLPFILVNVATAVLLIAILVRDVGLNPRAALLASLFFVLAPPVPASRLVEASSNVEPFLYVMLLWATRTSPVAFGLIAGLGFLHREFTAYAVAAIVLIEIASGTFFTRVNLKRKAIVVAEMAGVALLVRMMMSRADLLGPGSAAALPPELLNSQPGFWLAHFCWNPAALTSNLRWLAADNLGAIFGWWVGTLSDYANSTLITGHAWTWMTLAALLVASGAVVVAKVTAREPAMPSNGLPVLAFPAFLVIVGLQAIAVYAVLGCVVQDRQLVRFTLLAILIPIGLAAFALAPNRPRIARALAALAVAAWATASVTDHVRVLAEYLHRPPRDEAGEFARFLETEGVRYGRAPYWTAYRIDFLTNERVILGSFDKVRISEYEDLVNSHVTETTAVFFDDPCKDPGDVAFGRWCMMYFERARHPRSGS